MGASASASKFIIAAFFRAVFQNSPEYLFQAQPVTLMTDFFTIPFQGLPRLFMEICLWIES